MNAPWAAQWAQDWRDTLADLPGLYALCLILIAGYWLLRVARSARAAQRPWAAWWAVPGLALLFLTPLLDVPALLGVGAFLLLLAEYWPQAFRPGDARPPVTWPWMATLLGAALTWSMIRTGQASAFLMVVSGALTLAGLAGLLSSALFRVPRPTPELGFQTRWNATVTPDWPDLTVTLTASGAHLKNVSQQVLQVAGWSPVGVNAWLRVRDERGRVVRELRAGQVALLPVTERDSGVRVWYGKATLPDQPHLFRADWTPPARADQRVLN